MVYNELTGALSEPTNVISVTDTGSYRPLAVIPPLASRGSRGGYLVIGTNMAPDLKIFALPGCEHVYTHTLPNMKVLGLSADSWGTALVVCDGASGSVQVLEWPLPDWERWMGPGRDSFKLA